MAVKIKIDLSGFDNLMNDCRKAEVNIGEEIQKEVSKIAKEINDEAKSIAKSHTKYARKGKDKDRTYNHMVKPTVKYDEKREVVTARVGFQLKNDGHHGLASLFLMLGVDPHNVRKRTPKGASASSTTPRGRRATYVQKGTPQDTKLYDVFYGSSEMDERRARIVRALRKALEKSMG